MCDYNVKKILKTMGVNQYTQATRADKNKNQDPNLIQQKSGIMRSTT